MTKDDAPLRGCDSYVLHITHELLEEADPSLVWRDGPFVRIIGVGYLELLEDCPTWPKTWHAETRTPPKGIREKK